MKLTNIPILVTSNPIRNTLPRIIRLSDQPLASVADSVRIETHGIDYDEANSSAIGPLNFRRSDRYFTH